MASMVSIFEISIAHFQRELQRFVQLRVLHSIPTEHWLYFLSTEWWSNNNVLCWGVLYHPSFSWPFLGCCGVWLQAYSSSGHSISCLQDQKRGSNGAEWIQRSPSPLCCYNTPNCDCCRSESHLLWLPECRGSILCTRNLNINCSYPHIHIHTKG